MSSTEYNPSHFSGKTKELFASGRWPGRCRAPPSAGCEPHTRCRQPLRPPRSPSCMSCEWLSIPGPPRLPWGRRGEGRQPQVQPRSLTAHTHGRALLSPSRGKEALEMLLGSPGARQAQSHTLRPKASGEDLRSAGPKRERKEGLGGATHPPPALHNGEQRSGRPCRLLDAAGGRWEEAMGAAHTPPSPAGGETPGEHSEQSHAGQGPDGQR